jgi:type II secretory pathway pseudopilin PulG
VEVIVVLVILAILAAIAIPALTGYIDRAQEKQYISEARNVSVALRAVMDEAWANGELNTKSTSYVGNTFTGLKVFRISNLSSDSYSGGKSWELYQRTAALMKEEYVTRTSDPGYWFINLVAAKDSDATAVTADGFWFELYPEGMSSGKPSIAVTYRMSPVDGLKSTVNFSSAIEGGSKYFSYDAQAGYEVYHLQYMPRAPD